LDGKRENPLSHSKPLSEKYFVQPKLGFGTIKVITAALNYKTLKVKFDITRMKAKNPLGYYAITLEGVCVERASTDKVTILLNLNIIFHRKKYNTCHRIQPRIKAQKIKFIFWLL
jgi:hypothetical protein